MLFVLIMLVLLPLWRWNQTIPIGLEPNHHKAAASSLQKYVEHKPIVINNNKDFVAYGFPGNGNSSNPYIIAGLNITSSTKTLIQIQDTTVYFRIQDNLLNGLLGKNMGINLSNVVNGIIDSNFISNFDRGIILSKVVHGRVDSNIFSNCFVGISFSKSAHITMDYNTIPDGSEGIILSYAWNTTLTFNTISNCGKGIILNSSQITKLIYNTVSNNREYGIEVKNSENNTFSGNTISNNSQGGIILENSGNNTLLKNNFVNNGLVIIGEQDEHYIQTTVADNVVNGRPLIFWQHVSGGTVPPGAGQILLINTTGVEVTRQDLAWTTCGVLAAFSTHLNIHSNIVSNNTFGINLFHVEHTTLANNNVSQSEDTGIILWGSWNTDLSNNTLTYHQYGLNVTNSGNTTVSNNNVSQSEDTGIILWGSWNTGLSNNTLTYHQYGLNVTNSGNTTVTHNNVSQSEDTGVILWGTWNTTLSNNTLSYNQGFGIFLDRNSENNTIIWNNFLGNYPMGFSQASDQGNNNVFAHNYWDDHDTTDLNGDGLADVSYVIEGAASNQDLSPLTTLVNPPPPETTTPEMITPTSPTLTTSPLSELVTSSLLMIIVFLAATILGMKRRKDRG